MMRWRWTVLATFRRSSSAALVVVAVLVGLLAAGRWLQPRLDHGTPEAPSTRLPLTSPAPTGTTVATVARPPGSPGITKAAETELVESILVSGKSVWVLPVGGWYGCIP